MLTGQISSHALHDVQAHTSSGDIRSKTALADTVSSGSCPTTGEMGPAGRDSDMTWPTFSTISRGSSGLPVPCAGHTLVQRPHTVQASVSSNCVQAKSSMAQEPNDSSPVSEKFVSGFIAPTGYSPYLRAFLGRDVRM